MFGKTVSFILMSLIKLLCSIFYRYEVTWLNGSMQQWPDIRLLVFLNHTSLFEPVFIRLAPFGFIWRISNQLLAPGADITLARPITGRVFKLLLPGVVPISRKRDHSWQQFLDKIHPKALITILPEGRMMRRSGLDKHGKPMTVRGGIADILPLLTSGKILFVYSGGLHHVQAPGDKLPKVFKKIKANLELLDIEHYKQQLASDSHSVFKQNVIADLEKRIKLHVPNNS